MSKFTSIPVRPETLARLRRYKTGGATYDDVLNDLMDEQPTAEFIEEHVRRLREEPRVPLETLRKDLDDAVRRDRDRKRAKGARGVAAPRASKAGPRVRSPSRGSLPKTARR